MPLEWLSAEIYSKAHDNSEKNCHINIFLLGLHATVMAVPVLYN